MINRLTRVFRTADGSLKKRLPGIYALLIGMNLIATSISGCSVI